MLERITIPKDRLETVADSLIEWYDAEDRRLDGHGNPRRGTGHGTGAKAAIDAAFEPRTPAEIRDMIAGRVVGQESAAKAAMIVYSQLPISRTPDQRRLLRAERLGQDRDMADPRSGIPGAYASRPMAGPDPDTSGTGSTA